MFSIKQLKTALTGLNVCLMETWIIVVYDVTNGVSVLDVQAACTYHNARDSRVLTICSLVKSEGDSLCMQGHS